MINILIIEDEDTNAKILKFYFIEYFKLNNVEDFCIDIASNGWEALGMIYIKDYDLIFLDVMMPKCDGYKVLETIRIDKKNNFQPFICMVTALGDQKHKNLFKINKANAYAIKPFHKDTIMLIIDKFIGSKIKDDCVDADDKFIDFYKEDDMSNFDRHEIDSYNDVHNNITAIEFLKDYDNIEYILENVLDIDELLQTLIEDLDISTLISCRNDIDEVLTIYGSFLNSFGYFIELSDVLKRLSGDILNADFTSFDNKRLNYLVEFIRVILADLLQWKECVFIKQDANDVYYVNASVLNNCIELENLIKK
jgi:CheY-like chemotaxis protein